MEQHDPLRYLDLSQGKLWRFFLLASFICVTTDSSELQNCDSSLCTFNPDWQDNLTCYYIEKTGILKCSWLLLPNTSDSIVHIVPFKWNKHQHCTRTLPPVTVRRSEFHPDERVTVWVSANYSHKNCMKTKNISLVPNKTKKCPSLSFIRAYQLFDALIIKWNSPKSLLQYELQYREAKQATSQWIAVPVENGIFNMTISSVNATSTYVARLRCIPRGDICTVCFWSEDIWIPHKLTEKPTIVENSMEELYKGKRSLFLKWETTQRRNTIGYYIGVERISSYCFDAQIPLNITKNWVRLNLSMAYYRINISAYNEEGISPPVTYMVPEFTPTALPGQIKVLNRGNNTVITWNLTSNVTYQYFAMDWGTGIEDMETKVILASRREFLHRRDDFKPYQLYKVMLHTFDEALCNDVINDERTLAMAYFYATEGVPKRGPANVTIPIVTKHSALVKWTEISAEDSLGFLQGYRVRYTEILKNLSLTVTVKSTTHQYLLTELTPKTYFSVQISGFTSMGEGAPSLPKHFTTLKYDAGEFEQYVAGLCLGIILTMTAAVTLCSLMVKKTRQQCWPEVPNPRYSSALQYLDKTVPEDHLGLSLHPLLQSHLSIGATEIDGVENYSKRALSRQESLSRGAAEDFSTVYAEVVTEKKVGFTPNPLKIPAQGNASEKGKATFHSDYTSVEVSHRAMQRVSTYLPNPNPSLNKVDVTTEEDQPAESPLQDSVK